MFSPLAPLLPQPGLPVDRAPGPRAQSVVCHGCCLDIRLSALRTLLGRLWHTIARRRVRSGLSREPEYSWRVSGRATARLGGGELDHSDWTQLGLQSIHGRAGAFNGGGHVRRQTLGTSGDLWYLSFVYIAQAKCSFVSSSLLSSLVVDALCHQNVVCIHVTLGCLQIWSMSSTKDTHQDTRSAKCRHETARTVLAKRRNQTAADRVTPRHSTGYNGRSRMTQGWERIHDECDRTKSIAPQTENESFPRKDAGHKECSTAKNEVEMLKASAADASDNGRELDRRYRKHVLCWRNKNVDRHTYTEFGPTLEGPPSRLSASFAAAGHEHRQIGRMVR
ncbi:hypothetical protein R3P38DRAFT_2763564 [Favolaschia claudopus]|uniref:Uncharacterized protein n=1 Tax=Favolaschia claudopus TaxID=2862362 RepID=A0AAW0DJC2_9AGAR